MTSLRTALGSAGMIWCATAPVASAQPTPPAAADPLRALGLTVATSGSSRDTLGLLVAAVTRDGPADQAGITTGNRILAVNGQPTRLSADEIGRRSASDSAISRFVRAARVAAPSGDVMLKISGGGAIRTVAVPLGANTPSADATAWPTASPSPSTTPALRAPSPAPAARRGQEPAPPVDAPSGPPAQVVVVTTPSAAASARQALPVPVDSTTTRATPQASPAAPPSAAAASPSGTAVQPHGEVRSDETLPRIAEALAQIQLELRRVARASSSIPLSDSLADLEWQLSGIRRTLRALSGASAAPMGTDSTSAAVDSTSVLARWLRAADRLDARPVRPPASTQSGSTSKGRDASPLPAAATPVPVVAPGAASTVPPPAGIELARVSSDLAAYLGPQADSAVVVVRASEAYEPLKAGDVVLQADGSAPDIERLRATLAAHARVSLLLVRRGRIFTVLVGDATR